LFQGLCVLTETCLYTRCENGDHQQTTKEPYTNCVSQESTRFSWQNVFYAVISTTLTFHVTSFY